MLLIEKYEDEYFPIEAPDPIEAIKFRMEQMNMDNQDLAEVWEKDQLMLKLVEGYQATKSEDLSLVKEFEFAYFEKIKS
ncbi:MAG: hypothetical protein IH598_07655 [Bacteroidales bacterium]|nr:hypothetical protein [Bacteroidales bacterium]